jgi:RNA polymerase sigma-70 factor (ECF subfamily)
VNDRTWVDDRSTAIFEDERSRLVGLAYRMMGTPDDAHDVVQDAWLRWQRADHDAVDNPAAWLTTVTTRLAIDRLTSARARRETYVGPWLPEPLPPDRRHGVGPAGAVSSTDPSDVVAASETISLGFLRVLETLGPVERAVFLLHDVFGYTFDEIAPVVERSAAPARQIAKRARERVREGRPRIEPEPGDVEALSDAFFAAVVDGEIDRLMSMLTDDVVHVSDGGAEHHAARRPVVGPDKVARLFVNLARRNLEPNDEVHRVIVNGSSGRYITRGGDPFMLIVLGWRGRRLAEALAILNPHKLAGYHAQWSTARARLEPLARTDPASAVELDVEGDRTVEA